MSSHHHYITPNLSPKPSSSNLALPSFSSSLVSKVGMEMECVEGALKSSFRREVVAGKVGLPPVAEEFCSGVAVAVAPCEDFLVDELFDFSNEEDLVGGIDEEEEDDEKNVREQKGGLEGEGAVVPCGSADSVGKEDLPAVQTGEWSVPADDLADLEWLSQFVEDSFSGFLSPFPTAVVLAAQGKQGAKAEVAGVENRVFKPQVHARARRSKRTRTGGKGWMLGSPSLSETSSSSSSSSSSNCITSDTATLAYVEPSERPTKKQRKWGNYGSRTGQTAARKCSHCGVQKTPQWRAGPLGSKSLCNACGVRFKSGRLFPEYRPACSPTFSSELHSNHHRKVLEMRLKKESALPVQPERCFDHLPESILV